MHVLSWLTSLFSKVFSTNIKRKRIRKVRCVWNLAIVLYHLFELASNCPICCHCAYIVNAPTSHVCKVSYEHNGWIQVFLGSPRPNLKRVVWREGSFCSRLPVIPPPWKIVQLSPTAAKRIGTASNFGALLRLADVHQLVSPQRCVRQRNKLALQIFMRQHSFTCVLLSASTLGDQMFANSKKC